ncbi:MAG: histidine kinase [Akkermansiaceae bacterium]|jgi:signal transduction histidine kinase|nr:histidine kinase [Akkermansiaceae bacterium]
MRLLLLVILPLFTASLTIANEVSPTSLKLARLLSAELREDERTEKELRSRLEKMPPLSSGHRGENAGFHSLFQPERETPLDLVIDLGQVYPVERIIVFPVQGMFRGALIEGYGFPKNFLIELSVDEEFSEPFPILESSSLPLPFRPVYPMQFALDAPTGARYLRLRVLEHWTREDGRFLSAFGEMMVLSEGRNVALYSEVKADSFTTLPDWHKRHLVDGQVDLGLPVTPEPSPSNGFLSKGSKERSADKWIEIELPRAAKVDDVVIIPAQPVDAPDQFGHGFPRKFRLLISDNPEFENAHLIADFSERPFPNPGDNTVVFPGGGFVAKFIRLEVSEMWHISTGRFSITLAEMQVFEHGENVAFGAEVTASDVHTGPVAEVWKPKYLVDGFSSQNRLIGLEPWLLGLEERDKTERKIEEVQSRIETRIERTTGFVLGISAAIALSLMALTGTLLIRRKRTLAQQQESLRARIARDLHDDLGSRLGGMRLISESLLKAEQLPESLHEDLDLLNRSSAEATDAMRDIVWLLDTRERSLEKLRLQLKLLLPSILGSMPWEFYIDEAPNAEVNFEFRRQVVLAFRESLNNAARHSKSDRYECRVSGDSENFSFEVRDWGKGFDETTVKKGLGLNNLRKRAETLNGKITIKSQAGNGTTVIFSAPYRRSKRHRLP